MRVRANVPHDLFCVHTRAKCVLHALARQHTDVQVGQAIIRAREQPQNLHLHGAGRVRVHAIIRLDYDVSFRRRRRRLGIAVIPGESAGQATGEERGDVVELFLHLKRVQQPEMRQIEHDVLLRVAQHPRHRVRAPRFLKRQPEQETDRARRRRLLRIAYVLRQQHPYLLLRRLQQKRESLRGDARVLQPLLSALLQRRRRRRRQPRGSKQRLRVQSSLHLGPRPRERVRRPREREQQVFPLRLRVRVQRRSIRHLGRHARVLPRVCPVAIVQIHESSLERASQIIRERLVRDDARVFALAPRRRHPQPRQPRHRALQRARIARAVAAPLRALARVRAVVDVRQAQDDLFRDRIARAQHRERAPRRRRVQRVQLARRERAQKRDERAVGRARRRRRRVARRRHAAARR